MNIHIPMKAGAVKLERLNKSFGKVHVVQDVSLSIEPGEIVALLGASGCGKTTTLRMIAGLMRPDEGLISIAGKVVNDTPVERRDIGLLFQSYALFPHMTVLGNVAFGLRTWRRRMPKPEARQAALDALKLVRLEGFDERYPAALSGGQQQRVALARALVTQPRVLLLDEPLSALDKNLRAAMQAELRALVTRLGLTTILVTHDQEEAMTVADRIAVMDAGRIVQVGTAAELYERPRNKFIADFVGTTNLFEGVVERLEDNSLVLSSEGVRLSFPDGTGKPGQRRTVAVRPERIGVCEVSGEAVSDTVSGEVESIVYRGATIGIVMRLASGQKLYVAKINGGQSETVFRTGQTIAACWSRDANVVLED